MTRNDLFQSQRGSSGLGELLGVAGMLTAWVAIGAVMWSSFVALPVARAPDGCQVVCRPTVEQHSRG